MSEEWRQPPIDYRELITFSVLLVTAVLLGYFVASFNPSRIKIAAQITTLKRAPGYYYKPVPKFSGRRYPGKYWGNDKTWRRLGPYQMIAAMAILETRKYKDGSFCFNCSLNIVHTIINRAHKDGGTIKKHVSGKIYQPVIEPVQYRHLKKYVGSKAHRKLSAMAYARAVGLVKDRVGGATHYLVHPRIMVALHRKKPCKYWSWGPFLCRGKPGANWTGYNPSTKRYRNQVLVDRDHAFLAPEGKHSAPTKSIPWTK